MEPLNPRFVLAADGGVDTSLTETSDELATESAADASPNTVDELGAALSFDINADGQATPLDALLVINAVNFVENGGSLTDELFANYDVNADGQLSDLDISAEAWRSQ